MKIILVVIFVAIYGYELKYYKENNLSYVCPIVSAFLLILNILGCLNNNNDFTSSILYYIGFYFFAILAVWISYIPIYKHHRGFSSLADIINNYINILTDKHKTCRRSDYILLLLSSAILIVIFAFMIFITGNNNNDGIKSIFAAVLIFIVIINMYFQAKRLEDANLSKWFLLIYLASILGSSFAFVSSIVMFALLMLQSDDNSIPTTEIQTHESEDE